jgi:uncharacterized protein YbjT (DUF2867 family)
MEMKTLVIGASGNLGSVVAKRLNEKGIKISAGTRNPEKYSGPGKAVSIDFTDQETFKSSLEGVDKVFLMAPPLDASAAKTLPPFIDEAKKMDIKKVVMISAFGADASEEAPLRIIEKHLMASGLPYTIIRPNFFMENFTKGFISPMIKNMNGIFLAAGEGKTSFISVDDIATVAATALTEEGHENKEYNLTGSEALDHKEVAQIISSFSGSSINYVPLTLEDQKNGAMTNGMSEPVADYMNMLYGAVAAGYTGGITSDFEMVVGNKPTSFRDFAKLNTEHWKQD